MFVLGDYLKQDAAGFAPFGKISTVAGLQVAKNIFNPTPCCSDGGASAVAPRCDPLKNCSYGVNQGTYEALGNAWIKQAYPGINFIVGAAVTSVLKADDLFALDLQPAAPASKQAYRNSSMSSWGGNVVFNPKDKLYHLFNAAMTCKQNLAGWESNRQVVHSTATSPLGPFTAQDVVLPVWHHNPQVVLHPDGTWLILTIGTRDPQPKQKGCKVQEPSTRLGGPKTGEFIQLHHSSSPNGPWTFLNLTGKEDDPGIFGPRSCTVSPLNASIVSCPGCCATNPTPWVLKNGTMIIGSHDTTGFFLQVAPTWKGPYRRVSGYLFTEHYNARDPTGYLFEDPYLYFDKAADKWRVLLHQYPLSPPRTLVGGVASSATADILSEWKLQLHTHPVYTTTVNVSGGGQELMSHRERPKLYLNPETGAPEVLYTGVCPTGKQGSFCYTHAQPIDQRLKTDDLLLLPLLAAAVDLAGAQSATCLQAIATLSKGAAAKKAAADYGKLKDAFSQQHCGPQTAGSVRLTYPKAPPTYTAACASASPPGQMCKETLTVHAKDISRPMGVVAGCGASASGITDDVCVPPSSVCSSADRMAVAKGLVLLEALAGKNIDAEDVKYASCGDAGAAGPAGASGSAAGGSSGGHGWLIALVIIGLLAGGAKFYLRHMKQLLDRKYANADSLGGEATAATTTAAVNRSRFTGGAAPRVLLLLMIIGGSSAEFVIWLAAPACGAFAKEEGSGSGPTPTCMPNSKYPSCTTFYCPADAGSTCWLPRKDMAANQFGIPPSIQIAEAFCLPGYSIKTSRFRTAGVSSGESGSAGSTRGSPHLHRQRGHGAAIRTLSSVPILPAVTSASTHTLRHLRHQDQKRQHWTQRQVQLWRINRQRQHHRVARAGRPSSGLHHLCVLQLRDLAQVLRPGRAALLNPRREKTNTRAVT